ncbi:MAG: hypothetical protein ACJA2Q_001182 [Pseudohongiellaceae bacterium]|jgi:hypothetical protein
MRGIYKTLIAAICFCLASGFSNAASYEEHALKAAFLYNFADFINWPISVNNEASAKINYCVLKDGLIQASLESLINSDLNPKIERNFQLLTDLNKINTCNLIYIDASDLTANPNLLTVTSGLPILTASDQEGFLERGGMIELARLESRVKVRLNIDILNEYAFRVSSQLMRLASLYSLNSSSVAAE